MKPKIKKSKSVQELLKESEIRKTALKKIVKGLKSKTKPL